MSSDEHLAFFAECASRYPDQKHHNLDFFLSQLGRFLKPGSTVVEFGGWKGELAERCLNLHPEIERWVNFEVCDAAFQDTVVDSRRYFRGPGVNKFDWFCETEDLRGDIFVSAHAIEHLADEHLFHLLHAARKVPVLLLEAPLEPVENDWRGYGGTHILRMGWRPIVELLARLGYSHRCYNEHCWVFTKESL
jgi:hypothetical protein